MTDTDVDVPKPSPRRIGVQLSRPSRIVAFVLGIAGLGAGGAAVYITHLEAGPVGLMAVGLIFMVVALGGILPTRLKIGEGEAEWQAAAGEVIETALEAAPPSARAEIAVQLDDLAQVAPRAASPALSGFAYDQLILQIIQERLKDIPGALTYMTAVESENVSGEFDAAIGTSDGRMLFIDIKASYRLSAVQAVNLMNKSVAYGEALSKRTALLLITKWPLPAQIGTMFHAASFAFHVMVRGRKDEDALIDAIKRALASLKEPGSGNRGKRQGPPP